MGSSVLFTSKSRNKVQFRLLTQVFSNSLQRWVDEKQKGNSFRSVNCQQCQTEYIIVLPSMGLVADIIEAVDSLIRRSSPFLAAGVFVGSLYWTAVTYGAITVLQVLGHSEGLEILERTDHIFLLVSLPAIPGKRKFNVEDFKSKSNFISSSSFPCARSNDPLGRLHPSLSSKSPKKELQNAESYPSHSRRRRRAAG